jgi:hypothetical protein
MPYKVFLVEDEMITREGSATTWIGGRVALNIAVKQQTGK